jgi:hypothetical protein
LYPEEALAILAELKRQLRLHVIQRTGTEAARQVRRQLHQRAAQKGISPEIVEAVLAEHHAMIVERLGHKGADQILGEPDPTERYF